MKTRIILTFFVTGLLSNLIACNDPEGCERNPELCLATCVTNPEVCFDIDEIYNEVESDSILAVSKLPVRNK
ncbi:hypothetical protein JQC67_04465 [Aurantibacter crassamenti]|uniref:hypothetical protein n=1 Tax=Aurantibacter crassamenti TaxID=1837375 RepID=UPI0019394A7F|nr:hypothetical protein [Aurantibacter crassamenti]MBM1105389.1 hypothetical protein [Aurantibacter crassamenti]